MIKTFLLMPCYNPDEVFITFFKDLSIHLNEDFRCILINDGSSAQSEELINQAEQLTPYAVKISYPQNQGKGFAIKTGITFVLNKYSELENYNFIVADCDGQHSIEDILNFQSRLQEDTTDHLLLGVRKYSGWVPLHSKIGHALSNWLYQLLFKIKLTDTHCGLRGFNKKVAKTFLTIPWNRFDFECAMIPFCYKYFTVQTQPVKGIYNKKEYKTTYRIKDWLLNLKVLFQIKSFLAKN